MARTRAKWNQSDVTHDMYFKQVERLSGGHGGVERGDGDGALQVLSCERLKVFSCCPRCISEIRVPSTWTRR